MTRGIGDGPTAADGATAMMVDWLLYSTAAARRHPAKKEAVIIALEYRATLYPTSDVDFCEEVVPLPGTD